MEDFAKLHQKYRNEASRYFAEVKRRDYFCDLYDSALAKANVYEQCMKLNISPNGEWLSELQKNVAQLNIPETIFDLDMYLDMLNTEVRKVVWQCSPAGEYIKQ